jgi:hypothetical protein
MVVAIDTDVLSVYHIFQRDPRFKITSLFMEESREIERGVGIFNLLELCGVMATAGQIKRALRLLKEYHQRSDVKMLYPAVVLISEEEFWAQLNAEVTSRIERGMRFGDAAILWTLEANECELLITWNTKHFAGKTAINVQTPEEWLKEYGQD